MKRRTKPQKEEGDLNKEQRKREQTMAEKKEVLISVTAKNKLLSQGHI